MSARRVFYVSPPFLSCSTAWRVRVVDHGEGAGRQVQFQWVHERHARDLRAYWSPLENWPRGDRTGDQSRSVCRELERRHARPIERAMGGENFVTAQHALAL